MNKFDYLSVLVSIIVALGVSHILGAVFYGVLFVAAILISGTIPILVAISFTTNAVTIWGLMNASSRRYFDGA